MYLYQQTNRYFAQAPDDVKDIAEAELRALGVQESDASFRGIHFAAIPEVLYKVNYQSRLINRILAPLIKFKCPSDHILYEKASMLKWDDFLDNTKTFAIFATVSNSQITHSKYAALRLKDAIVDYFRNRTGERPSIDTREPDVWFNLHIDYDEATISLDTSGGSLHRRGYRKESVEAPMIETLAAAIIKHSGWNGQTPLYDPLCGSGTLLCEAYLHAANIPGGILRPKFGFERLPDFDASLWQKVKEAALQNIKPIPPGLIAGSDKLAAAVRAAQTNCAVLDKNKAIEITQQDMFKIKNPGNRTIVCNPPYGIRLGKDTNLYRFYKNWSDFLKQRCRNSVVFIYFGEKKYLKSMNLKPSWKKPLAAGGLDGRLVKYELY